MSDSDNIMGISASPDDWNPKDDKAVRGFLFDCAAKDGHYGAPEDWHLCDQFLPLAVEMRMEAKRVALQSGKELSLIWNTIKKRIMQDVSEVINGAFKISNHH